MSDLTVIAELAGLGLAAVDPIGIAFMPILLAQPRGGLRASTFLAGSFGALVALGLLFTTGIGTYVLEFNRRYPWLEPGIEVFGGVVLVLLGLFMVIRARRGETAAAPESLVRRLELPLPTLFGFGAALVTVQSLVDVVFVVAMVEAGTSGISFVATIVSVFAYAVAALLIQAGVVAAYYLTAAEKRDATMVRFTAWLNVKGELVAGWVSLLLGVVLLATTGPDLWRAI